MRTLPVLKCYLISCFYSDQKWWKAGWVCNLSSYHHSCLLHVKWKICMSLGITIWNHLATEPCVDEMWFFRQIFLYQHQTVIMMIYSYSCLSSNNLAFHKGANVLNEELMSGGTQFTYVLHVRQHSRIANYIQATLVNSTTHNSILSLMSK